MTTRSKAAGAIGTAGIGAAAAAMFAAWVRPRLMRWGATDEEVHGSFPGADVVPGARRSATMAVTIDVPPENVWPWIVQLGWDRGGWYSWDVLDNGGRPSAGEIHPEWQDLAVGDRLRFCLPGGKVADAYEVQEIEPNRYLGLYGLSDLRGRLLDPNQPRPGAYMEATWGFLLRALPGGRTRLVISGYQVYRPRWFETLFLVWGYIPMVWPMQARMLAVLKRNIERSQVVAAPNGPPGGPALETAALAAR